MKSVLRIISSYFSCLPLQRWVNIIGALLLAIGILLTLRAPDLKTSFRMTFTVALPGAFMITILPLALGGMALRFASSRSVLHLRPHGRSRILLGSILTLVLIATIFTLPLLAQHHVYMDLAVRRTLSEPRPFAWFLGAGAFAAAAWLLIFVSSSSRLLTTMSPTVSALLPVLLMGKEKGPSPAALQTIGALIFAAWAIFALWYSRVACIKRPDWVNDGTPLAFNGRAFTLMQNFSRHEGGHSRVQALRLYLFGSNSILANIVAGAFPGILALAMTLVFQGRDHLPFPPPSFFMSLLALVAPFFGYLMALKSRTLWLRAGIDRPALFHIAERFGLPTTLLIFSSFAAVLLLGSMWSQPEQILNLLLHAATYGILTAALFYFGLSLTQGWNTGDVLCGIGLFILNLVIVAVIKQNPSATAPLVAAGIFAALALLLRWHARRRWRALDWRIAKLPWASRT